jgi:hypothetical protein
MIEAASQEGLLYGAFALLRKLQTELVIIINRHKF